MAAQLRLAAHLPEVIISDPTPKRRMPAPAPTVVSKPHITDSIIDSSNWYKHINWLNVTVLLIIPSAAMYTALSTPLQLKTALWAVAYYFITGIGITAGMALISPQVPETY